jgi:DNA polymerase-3 subunit epsilon
MRKVYDELTAAFRRNDGVLSSKAYDRITNKHATLFENSDTIFVLLQASGYPIEEEDGFFRFRPYFTPYGDEVFCVVDIETNGSKPGTSQVIEIGAVKVQGGEVIDRFETYVACAYLPDQIIKLTGIEPADLNGAPNRREALTMLREFLDDAVFVAHNVNFDFSFLTASFERFGLGSIGNPRMCTIDLARRTFESERYGLAYLNETLELGSRALHRAYCDAKAASKVMLKSFDNLPDYIETTDELLRFSTSSMKTRNRKKDKIEILTRSISPDPQELSAKIKSEQTTGRKS